jgi:hypothetical protein
MIPDLYFERSRKIGVSLLAISLIFWFIAESSPELSEHFYARVFYPYLASRLAVLGAILPFAVTDLIILGFIFWYLLIPVRQYRRNKSMGNVGVGIHIFLSFIATTGLLLFLVMFTFLFNHHRYNEEKLNALDFELDDNMYQSVVKHSVERANALSAEFPKNERLCTEINFSLRDFDLLIESEQSRFLIGQGLPAVKGAQTRYFLFSYIWAGMGVGGQYQPIVAQTNITKELPEYTKPFIIGHERGHLNGFASEAGATLLSTQTLLHSKDRRLEYLGLLGLWRSNPPEGINEQVVADIKCWNEDYDKMPRFKYKKLWTNINDAYLKASGHKDGVKSYDWGKVLGLKYYYLTFVKEKLSEEI